eukprot:9984174-Lingulodinium_polyedra.AAC.1
MALGAFLQPVQVAWALLTDLNALDRAGFATSPLAAKALVDADSWEQCPLLVDEDLWVSWM